MRGEHGADDDRAEPEDRDDADLLAEEDHAEGEGDGDGEGG
ncbi:hypothetical protein ABT344_22090 [Micromonospora carbonacea]